MIDEIHGKQGTCLEINHTLNNITDVCYIIREIHKNYTILLAKHTTKLAVTCDEHISEKFN